MNLHPTHLHHQIHYSHYQITLPFESSLCNLGHYLPYLYLLHVPLPLLGSYLQSSTLLQVVEYFNYFPYSYFPY